ncbi:MAG: hypothetical protein F9K47_18800, partial [Burkholderiales bacterium]
HVAALLVVGVGVEEVVGDMVRVGGLKYRCQPHAAMGTRISDMQLAGKPIEADQTYRVAGWAPVAPGASGEPIWELVARWLRAQKTVATKQANVPELTGVAGDPGVG